jgi:nitrite transporter NirC
VPASPTEALHDVRRAAADKAHASRATARFVTAGALAGVFVGIAVVLLLSAAGPLAAAASPWAKLVQGLSFGVALTLIVFAGAELATGNVYVLVQGLAGRTVTARDACRVLLLSFAGNLLGSLLFAAAVDASGVLRAGPGRSLLSSVLAAKGAATGPELFWRAVLCNVLVCLGLWMAVRAVGDGAKLAVLAWALLAFVASGFEHSVANVTTFALGALGGDVGWGALVANLLWTVPGNVVGGAAHGAAYHWVPAPPVAVRAPTDDELEAIVAGEAPTRR